MSNSASLFINVAPLHPLLMHISAFWMQQSYLPLYMFLPLCISGGKDSCYNMMQCVAAGHQIVALANLRPANTGEEKALLGFVWSTTGANSNVGQPPALLLNNKLRTVPAFRANKNSSELFTFYKNLVENKTHPLTVLEIYSIIILIIHFNNNNNRSQ